MTYILQVACVDYPRPDIDNTANFLEAAKLSSSFRASARPPNPLKVVIAGAGDVFSPFIFLSPFESSCLILEF